VRNVAKDYRFTRLRRKSAPVRSWPSCQFDSAAIGLAAVTTEMAPRPATAQPRTSPPVDH
jgi:hypothetical protein